MPLWLRFLIIAEALTLCGLTSVLLVVGLGLTLNGTGSVWDALAGVGTVAATFVAVWLAYRAYRESRRASVLARGAIARLVSAWVTEDFVPVGEFSYQRLVVVHVANESNEPVFDAHVSVVVGQNPFPLGPLSAPASIAVLPQRRERSFDISMPMRAHDDTWNPRVELSFTDANGTRWLRDAEGALTEMTGVDSRWEDAPHDERQLGSNSLENPMFVARGFMAALTDADSIDTPSLLLTLAPEATGWAKTNWAETREKFEKLHFTSMVDYPAPYVARVKLSSDASLVGKSVVGERMSLDVEFLTLTFAPGRGWRVWGHGQSVVPDRIMFPPGTFTG
jgi:hypothetical protein